MQSDSRDRGVLRLPTGAPIAAIVFDCDGVLVDSERSWLQLIAAAARARGVHDLEIEHFRGLTVAAAAAKLGDALGVSPELLRAELGAAFADELRSGIALMPGIAEFIASVYGRVPLAVASNSDCDDLDLLLDSPALRGRFDAVVGADDVELGKPDPALYLLAAKRLGVDPAACLAIEDSPVGASAALLAGMHVVGANADPAIHLPVHERVASISEVPALIEGTTSEATLLAWNLWFGGREITDGIAKQAELVAEVHPDAALLQECSGSTGEAIAGRLGWHVRQQSFDNAVVTPHRSRPLGTDTDNFATAAVVDFPQLGRVLVWSVHLWFDDYGPYVAAEGQAVVDAQPGEQRRIGQIEQVLDETERMLGRDMPVGTPVIIAGDFNCPASGDWAARSDRPAIVWGATDRMLAAGFTDAFRAVHPSAAAAGGETWSPIEPDEPFDRIDFVFVRGLEVTSARVLGATSSGFAADWFEDYGGECRPRPDQAGNRFASDHQALVVTVARR